MVKQRRKNNKKRRSGKGFYGKPAKARKINASTVYDTCSEQLSPFGGLLALIKFSDSTDFQPPVPSGIMWIAWESTKPNHC